MRLASGFNADLPVSSIVEYSQLAEKLGYESQWMHEHSFGRDSVSILSNAATVTKKIKLGFGCVSPYVRHPVNLGMTLETLQEFSNGRAILGIGTGFPMRLDLMGIKHDRPIAAIKDTIEICRRIWSGDPVTYSGNAFSVKNVKSLLAAPQKKIPIFIAGWKKQMLMLTGKYADGYLAKGGESTQSIGQIVTSIKSFAGGRNFSDIEISAYLLTLVATAKKEALDRARKDPFVIYMLSVQDDYLYQGTDIDPSLKKPIAENYFRGKLAEASSNIRDEMLDSFTINGTSDQVCDRILEYVKSGVSLPILQPISLRAEDVRAVLESGAKLIAS